MIVSYEQGHYVIKNAEYNADIAGNSSVHIGIVAGEGAAGGRPENFTMQQIVVGDATTGTESGSEEAPEEETPELSDEEMEAIIAERLKGVKYTEPTEEHIKYDEVTNTYYVDNQLLIVTREDVTLEEVEALAAELDATIVGYILLTGDYQLEFSNNYSLIQLTEKIEQLSENGIIEDVSLHECVKMNVCMVPNDPMWNVNDNSDWDKKIPSGTNWGLEMIE